MQYVGICGNMWEYVGMQHVGICGNAMGMQEICGARNMWEYVGMQSDVVMCNLQSRHSCLHLEECKKCPVALRPPPLLQPPLSRRKAASFPSLSVVKKPALRRAGVLLPPVAFLVDYVEENGGDCAASQMKSTRRKKSEMKSWSSALPFQAPKIGGGRPQGRLSLRRSFARRLWLA